MHEHAAQLALTTLFMIAASYRLTRLITKDTFPPVLWLRDKLAGGWRPLTRQEAETFRLVPLEEGQSATVAGLGSVTLEDGEYQRYVDKHKRSPYWLAELITCPWCASAYISLAVVGAVTLWTPLPALGFGFVLVWLTVWAGASLIAGQEWS